MVHKRLALAVCFGEGASGALERVCRLSHGQLAAELRQCLADARAGANLPVLCKVSQIAPGWPVWRDSSTAS
jgi:hypothetical protein